MLELLLYCHLFAKLRFAGEIAFVTDAVMDLIGQGKARYAPWFGSPVPKRRESILAFGCWSEPDLARALDRLDAFVTSVA